MSSANAPRHRYTYQEYLELEAQSPTKHEFYDGEIYAMAGGTPEHASLTAALIATLAPQLRGGPCRVYSSDLRVRVLATGLVTYPDVSVICGGLVRDPESHVIAVNPTAVFEVLSPSTRGPRFDPGFEPRTARTRLGGGPRGAWPRGGRGSERPSGEDGKYTLPETRNGFRAKCTSTEDYDRGEKLAHYHRIESLQHCVLVAQRERRLEGWARGADGAWQRSEARPGSQLALPAIGCIIPVAEFYDSGLEGTAKTSPRRTR